MVGVSGGTQDTSVVIATSCRIVIVLRLWQHFAMLINRIDIAQEDFCEPC